MITEIAYQLISQYSGKLSFFDKWAGLVVPLKKMVDKTEKTFPVYINHVANCNNSQLMDLLPSSDRKSVIYVEKNGEPTVEEIRTNYYIVTAPIRIVCWYNLDKINGGLYLDDGVIINNILQNTPKSLADSLFEYSRSVKLFFKGSTSGSGIFDKYTYNEVKTQFTTFPYGAVALDYEVSYVMVKCSDPLSPFEACGQQQGHDCNCPPPVIDPIVAFTQSEKDKLAGIEAGAEVNDPELDPLSLHLDQTVPQSVINGAPVFQGIDFDTTPSTDPNTIGRLQWNGAEKSLEYGVEGGTIDVNKEIFDYYVDNTIGDILVEGDVVSVTAISGNRQAVSLTDCTTVQSSTACIGMVTNVNSDNTVRVTKKGRVRKVDTAGMVEGMPVYVDVANPGKYTQTAPDAPNYFIHVGIVEVANANNGIIDVDIRVSPKMSDLSDVDGIPLNTTGQFPTWHNNTQTFDFDHNISEFAVFGFGDKSSAADAGTLGHMSLGDDYLYLCTLTGTAGNAIWKKTPLFKAI